MERDKHEHFALPNITNTKVLKAGVKIFLHKEMAAPKAKLMNAEVVEEQEDDEEASAAASSAEQPVSAPPAKRQRKR